MFSGFSFNSHMTRPEVINALQRVRSECNKVLEMSFLNTAFTYAQPLDDFVQQQNSTISAFSATLSEHWTVR